MRHTLVMAGALLLGALNPLGDAVTLRCEPGGLVSSGATTADVRRVCGEPTHQETTKECREVSPAGTPRADGRKPFRVTECVTVKIWTYNFGPRRLVQRLLFRNGRLDAIETPGYGQ